MATVIPMPAAIASNRVPLGRHSQGPLELDLDRLLAGRLLIQGSSGAGKSRTLRRIVEEAFDYVTVMIVDPEGDFGNLGDHIGATTIRAVELTPEGLTAAAARGREHRLPLHLDLSDLDPDDRITRAAGFFAGLVGVPRALWPNTVMVAIDEAHLLAPHVAGSARDAETRKLGVATLTDLCSRGRKRGLAPVVATQRLAKLATSVVSELQNFLVGLNVFDRDIARAADLLGFDTRAAEKLRQLQPGEFYAFGPALSLTPVMARIDATITEHLGATPDLLEASGLDRDQARDLLALEGHPGARRLPPGPGGNRRGADCRRPSPDRAERYDRRRSHDALGDRARAGRFGARHAGQPRGRRHDAAGRGAHRAARRAPAPAHGRDPRGGAVMSAATDLGDDIVELVACPLPAASAPLREMSFRAASWLPAEDDELRRRFTADEALADIAVAIGRPFHGLRARIDVLGLRRNSTRPWHEAEDAELFARYGQESCATIARSLGRGVTAVYARAALLKLTAPAPADYDAWEDAQIRAGYAQAVPVRQIAALIGRSMLGVCCRASALGVRHPHQPPNWSDAEMQRMLELAEEGHRYLEIIEMMVAEGYPRRSKSGFGQRIRIIGYGRGWGRRWTPDEDELLRRAYAAGDTLTPLRQLLGRGVCSIRWRAGELGLRGTHAKRDGWRGRVWSAEDEALLRAEFGNTPSPELARKLGRTKAAMFSRANALGLVHGYLRPWTPDERRALGIVWRLGLPLAVIAKACGRDPAAVSKQAIKLGIAFDSPDRPVLPSRGIPGSRRGTKKPPRPDMPIADILQLLPPDREFDGRLEAAAAARASRASINRGNGARNRAAQYRERHGIPQVAA